MKPRTIRRRGGFTLIELMIVVSIIGVLASIAIPKFAQLLRKSQKGTTKGNLGALRSVLSIYYADNEGLSPSCAYATNSSVLTDSFLPKYTSKIPDSNPSTYHAATNRVMCHTAITPTGCTHDGYGWIYNGATPTNQQLHGSLFVACYHTDTKGSQWRVY
ncbi:MAG: prepilin-type N-terminal cleavage/methylation domain-containing protein [Elusimicrobia bacterium]|nr:prepilin-type N-terminal cleavage/methylation domain-containing protein [Elusimicrobiota bacterium]